MLARHIMFFALLLFVPVSAGGHVNERGMDYRSFKDSAGSPCCSNEDCYAAEKFTETVETGSEVIRLFVDDIGIANVSAYSNGLMGYETPTSTASPERASSSSTTTASSRARPAARRSSPASTSSAPA